MVYIIYLLRTIWIRPGWMQCVALNLIEFTVALHLVARWQKVSRPLARPISGDRRFMGGRQNQYTRTTTAQRTYSHTQNSEQHPTRRLLRVLRIAVRVSPRAIATTASSRQPRKLYVHRARKTRISPCGHRWSRAPRETLHTSPTGLGCVVLQTRRR